MITTAAGKGAPLTPAEADANMEAFDLRTKEGWMDIVSEFYTRGGPSAPPVSSFIGGIYLLEFQDAVNSEAFANFHIPHQYKPGSMIYPHIHFATKANVAGRVRWGFEWTFARRHDSTGAVRFPATQIIYIDFDVPANSGDYAGQGPIHFVAEAAQGLGIPGTDIEVDGMIMCRVFRAVDDANDNFAGSVFAITSDLHIEIDRMATPSRAPNFYA